MNNKILIEPIYRKIKLFSLGAMINICTLLFFSMEISGEKLTTMLLSSDVNVNNHALCHGELGDDDMQRMFDTLGKVEKWSIYMNDRSTLSALELRSNAQFLHCKLRADGKQLAMVMVDYLQLMGESGAGDNQVVWQFSRALKTLVLILKVLAKGLNLLVVALLQSNRSLKSPPNRRSQISDPRESRAIKQNADLIMFVCRDNYYNEDSRNKGVVNLIHIPHYPQMDSGNQPMHT